MIRVAICQWHPPTTWRRGGGETHARKHVEHLSRIDGVEASFFDPNDLREIDILHIIGTNYHLNEFGRYARAQGIKVVLTPVAFSRHAPWKFRAVLGALKLARMRIPLWMRKEILEGADLILANTQVEKQFLSRAYSVSAAKIGVVGVGAELERYLHADASVFGEEFGVEDFVLCVGRVNPYKGQLSVLEALASTPHRVVLVGEPDADYPGYASAVERFVDGSERMLWIKGLPGDSPLLASAYAASRCHVLFSRGETAGLVNLEAMAAGTVAITKPHATVAEMLGEHAVYASSPEELRVAVGAVFEYSQEQREKRIAAARELVASRFTWGAVARETAGMYETLLGA